MYKTERFNKIMDAIGTRYKRVLSLIGDIAIISGFIFMIITFAGFIFNLFSFSTQPSSAAGVIPLIPGITISFNTFQLLIIPLIITVIPHELFHGIFARLENVKVKSSGIILLAVFGAAFVEPDVDDLMNARLKSKLRILSVGSFANILTFLLFLGLLGVGPLLLTPFYSPQPNGIVVLGLYEDGPAEKAGIKPDMALVEMKAPFNNSDVKWMAIKNATNFQRLMKFIDPGDTITFKTNNGKLYNVTTISRPEELSRPGENATNSAFVGITFYDYYPKKVDFLNNMFPYYFFVELLWTANLNFIIALMNLFPIPYLTDGDKMLAFWIDEKIKNKQSGEMLLRVIRSIALAVLILNIVLSFTTFGIRQF